MIKIQSSPVFTVGQLVQSTYHTDKGLIGTVTSKKHQTHKLNHSKHGSSIQQVFLTVTWSDGTITTVQDWSVSPL